MNKTSGRVLVTSGVAQVTLSLFLDTRPLATAPQTQESLVPLDHTHAHNDRERGFRFAHAQKGEAGRALAS